nr:phage tail protein [Cyclobacterium plantarum]
MSEETQDNEWPEPKFNFTVTFDAQENIAVFQEIACLDMENQRMEFRSRQFSMIKMPGRVGYGAVTLKKGVLRKDNDFFTWFDAIKMNTIKLETVVIQLIDEQGSPTMTWRLLDVGPQKLLVMI